MAPEDDHRHCKVCGRVCAPGQEWCSKACARVLDDRARTRRNYTLMLYGAIALTAIVLLSPYLARV
jgi:predicted nucleic acid-binding Zn ribbon protein